MRRTTLTLLSAMFVLAPIVSRAAEPAAPMPSPSAMMAPDAAMSAKPISGKPTAAEEPFVEKVTADLTARFPTPELARKAGYLRYTDEDNTGAISYANRKWTSIDAEHPSQLWYDAKNRLIGADFSMPVTSTKPPELFGVTPSRWQKFGAHVHYGLATATGSTYGGAGEKVMTKGGATVAKPTKAALVKAGVAKKLADVRFVFTFPAIWDLGIWLVPNPSGAFADKNPDVKPVNPPKEMSM